MVIQLLYFNKLLWLKNIRNRQYQRKRDNRVREGLSCPEKTSSFFHLGMGGRGGAPRSFFPEPETERNIQTHTQAHKQMRKTMIVL